MLRAAVLFVLAAFSVGGALAQSALKPGDVVTLTCDEDATLNSDYTITSQGLLLIKYIGAVEVQGLTPQQAAQKVSRELVRQQVMPKATVAIRIKGESSPSAQQPLPVNVGGAVRNPLDVAFREGLKLSDVLTIADPTTVADLKNVRITRLSGEVGTIDFTQYQAGNDAGNPLLRPGDRIFLPLKVASFQVSVLGAVMRPGIVEFAEDMTVRKAIELSGGLRSDANPERVEITGPDQDPFNFQLLGDADMKVEPGTKIVVGVREVREHIFVRGSVARPGLLPYKPGMTITDAILDAQPFEAAGLNRVRLSRRDTTGAVKVDIYDVRQIQAGKLQDVLLKPEDTIDVPYPVSSYRTQDTMKFVGIGLLLYFVFFRR